MSEEYAGSRDLIEIRDHVGACPLGWRHDRLIMHKSWTEADVIKWLAELRELVGLKGYESDATGEG